MLIYKLSSYTIQSNDFQILIVCIFSSKLTLLSDMAPKRPIVPLQEVPKKRIAPNGVRLPDPIREGEVFTDTTLNTWRLGQSIGLGGFGEIYLGEIWTYLIYILNIK